jgi:hypothetical protein
MHYGVPHKVTFFFRWEHGYFLLLTSDSSSLHTNTDVPCSFAPKAASTVFSANTDCNGFGQRQGFWHGHTHSYLT